MVPPYEPQSEKLPGVASWAECRYWWPAAVAFVMQSFLTFFTGGFTLFIFVVEIIEAAGGSRRAAGVIVVLFGVAKLLATLGVVAAIDDTDRRPLLAVCCVVLALANGAFSLVFSSSKPSLTLAAVLVIVMATAFPPAFGARPRPHSLRASMASLRRLRMMQDQNFALFIAPPRRREATIYAQARSTLFYWASYFLQP